MAKIAVLLDQDFEDSEWRVPYHQVVVLGIKPATVKGKRGNSIRTDLVNAGATWVDAEVVVDGVLITSRKPEDLEAFSNALLERLV